MEVERDSKAGNLELPRYMSAQASGMDIPACVDEAVVIQPGEWRIIPTGLKVCIPAGYEAQIRPRSGLALEYGVTVLNTPGTIDGDYRGELQVILINLGGKPFTVRRGDRIAQIVFTKVERAELVLVQKIEGTERDSGGFGHTGT